MTCTSTRARSLSRGLSRSWEARRTRSRGRKLGFGLFGVVGAVLMMAGPAAAQELEFMPAGDIEALLASLLSDRFGHVVPRTDLANAGWPAGLPSRNSLDVQLGRLRRRLEGSGLVLRTVRSRGCLLDAQPAT